MLLASADVNSKHVSIPTLWLKDLHAECVKHLPAHATTSETIPNVASI